MNPFRFLLTALLLLLTLTQVLAQDSNRLMVVFYNVENLFHPNDDSLKNDDAFTPQGQYHWTYKKFVRKVNNIAKVLIAMDGYSPPEIIGLEEVEEASVLKKLCADSPLKKYHYRYVHYDSPDARGVDVALLYRSDRVRILNSRPVPVIFPFDTTCRNRDLLYVVAELPNRDTLHILVNHWTSRFGGYAPTIIKRNYYASVVRKLTDSILDTHPDARIVIGGDFNDYPTDESITQVLQAGDWETDGTGHHHLYDLMFHFLRLPNIGSHKHEDFWGCLDHIIVSQSLLDTSMSTHIEGGLANVFKADFMVEPDEKYGGYRVYRTYSGPRYIGGYADHLPVYIMLHNATRKKDAKDDVGNIHRDAFNSGN